MMDLAKAIALTSANTRITQLRSVCHAISLALLAQQDRKQIAYLAARHFCYHQGPVLTLALQHIMKTAPTTLVNNAMKHVVVV